MTNPLLQAISVRCPGRLNRDFLPKLKYAKASCLVPSGGPDDFSVCARICAFCQISSTNQNVIAAFQKNEIPPRGLEPLS